MSNNVAKELRRSADLVEKVFNEIQAFYDRRDTWLRSQLKNLSKLSKDIVFRLRRIMATRNESKEYERRTGPLVLSPSCSTKGGAMRRPLTSILPFPSAWDK